MRETKFLTSRMTPARALRSCQETVVERSGGTTAAVLTTWVRSERRSAGSGATTRAKILLSLVIQEAAK